MKFIWICWLPYITAYHSTMCRNIRTFQIQTRSSASHPREGEESIWYIFYTTTMRH